MLCFCENRMNKILIQKEFYYKCENCGYLKKINKPSPDKEFERYENHIVDEAYKKYMFNIMNKVIPYMQKGLTLDFGCGKIHYLCDLLNENRRPCKYYDKFYYPIFPKDVYDNIILIEVFEHIENSLQVLFDLKAHLSKNGKILIMTQIIPKDIEHWWYLRDITHISFVTPKTMKILAQKINMQVEYIQDSSLFILFNIK